MTDRNKSMGGAFTRKGKVPVDKKNLQVFRPADFAPHPPGPEGFLRPGMVSAGLRIAIKEKTPQLLVVPKPQKFCFLLQQPF